MRFFDRHKNIILVLLFALVLRIALSFFGTLGLDHGTFVAWSNILAKDGFRNFYNSWSDYLPGYLYFLWGLGKVNSLRIFSDVLLYKLPANLADLTTGFLIYKIIKKLKGEKWGLISASLYLFNPAIFGNSALWGQVDSLTSLLSMLSVYLLPSSIFWSAVSLSFGTLVKPQTAFIFPVILYSLFKNKTPIKKYVVYLITGTAVFVCGFVPFWNHGTLIGFIFERLGISANQYPYTSVNAFNFWGLTGFWKPDNLYVQFGGYLFVFLLLVVLFFKLWKLKNPEYPLVAFVFAASFIFFTRMHERHLLPVFAPLVVSAIENPYLLIVYLVLSLTYIANLYYSYVWITDNFRQVFPDILIKFFEVLATLSSVSIFYILFKNLNIAWKKVLSFKDKIFSDLGKPQVKVLPLPKASLSDRQIKYLLGLVLAFALLTRIFDLGSPQTMYFDEVYHAFTAKVIMSADRAKAWEWWNTPPSGFAYEWTHPPFAKLGMVLGMFIFGQNSFGWRIPGAILGVGSVLMVYLLAKEIFKDDLVGLISAAVFSLDGLALVMSRIGMNDSYILFFALLSIYLYLKDKNFLSSLAFGLSVASKWSAVWAVPIFLLIFVSRKKRLDWSYLWFFTIPIIVYIGSYFDMFLTGHNLEIWWGMQEQMWWYHTGLKATHPYSSMWWSWPFLIRPIYLYTSDEIGGWVSRIYAFGNPVVFWFGFASVLIGAAYSYLEKNKNLALVVFSYFIFFAPWALSPRIMFLYHYLPSIPFLAIATGYVLRRNQKLMLPFFTAAFIIFVYFFPHYIGLKIPLWLDSSYYWFSSWR